MNDKEINENPENIQMENSEPNVSDNDPNMYMTNDHLTNNLNSSFDRYELIISENLDFIAGPQIVAASEYTVVNYIYYKGILEKVGFILLGICLLILISAKKSIEFLFLMFFLYCLFGIFFALYFLVKCSNLALTIRKTFILDILLDTGYSILFLSYFLVFLKIIDISVLPFLIIPHIILMTARMCSSFDRQTHADNQVWAFFEAFQILWISLKLANTNGQPDWGWVLLLIYIVVVGLLIVGMIASLALGCLLGVIMNMNDANLEQKNILKFLAHALYHIAWKSMVFFYLLRNFHQMGNENKFGPGMPLEPKGNSLVIICGVMIVFAFIDIIILIRVSDTLKRLLSTKMFISNKQEEIAVQTLSNPMNMHLMQVGANYFQSNRNQPEDQENPVQTKKTPEILDCMICCDRPSNTLIRPCNHGGTCEECMIRYMESKNCCPHCKTKIKKVYIVDFDEENENFMAKRVIRCQ